MTCHRFPRLRPVADFCKQPELQGRRATWVSRRKPGDRSPASKAVTRHRTPIYPSATCRRLRYSTKLPDEARRGVGKGNRRQVADDESGDRSPHSKLVVVGDVQLIDLEAINSLDRDWRRGTLKPGGRTPRILICNSDEAMLNRVLMNIVQTRQIRTLVSQFCVPKIVPYFASRGVIKLIYLASSIGV